MGGLSGLPAAVGGLRLGGPKGVTVPGLAGERPKSEVLDDGSGFEDLC